MFFWRYIDSHGGFSSQENVSYHGFFANPVEKYCVIQIGSFLQEVTKNGNGEHHHLEDTDSSDFCNECPSIETSQQKPMWSKRFTQKV